MVAELNPLSKAAFKLVTSVVEETVNGAVPVATVEINLVPWIVEAAVKAPAAVRVNVSENDVWLFTLYHL